MQRQEIFQQIEKFLDEWDPIGILQDSNPILYIEGAIGEYDKYIKPVIEVFLSEQSIYDYLIIIYTELRDYPNGEMKEEIKLVAERMTEFLSRCKIEDIQEY